MYLKTNALMFQIAVIKIIMYAMSTLLAKVGVFQRRHQLLAVFLFSKESIIGTSGSRWRKSVAFSARQRTTKALNVPFELEWFTEYAQFAARIKSDGGTDGRFYGCRQAQR